MTTLFKAVRLDGGSFNDPGFKWALTPGGVTEHPLYGSRERAAAEGAAGYLSVATVATDCTGMNWPCRLLQVEPVGRLWTPDADGLPNKRAGLRFRTVREVAATDALGPQGVQVAALTARAATLTVDEAKLLYAAANTAWYAAWSAARYAARYAARDAAWYAARYAARSAARYAARYAAWDAAWDAARYAAWDAARALVVRDLIDPAHYDTLTMPWRATIGRIHPDDADVTA